MSDYIKVLIIISSLAMGWVIFLGVLVHNGSLHQETLMKECLSHQNYQWIDNNCVIK